MSAQCGDLLYVGRACTFWLKRSSGGEKEAEENIKVTGYRKKTNIEISLTEVELVVIKILMKLSNLMKTVNMAYLKQKKKKNKKKSTAPVTNK